MWFVVLNRLMIGVFIVVVICFGVEFILIKSIVWLINVFSLGKCVLFVRLVMGFVL